MSHVKMLIWLLLLAGLFGGGAVWAQNEQVVEPGRPGRVELVLPDGQVAQMVLPITAVREATAISVAQAGDIVDAGGLALSPAIAFGPEGFAFHDIVTIILPLRRLAGVIESEVHVWRKAAGAEAATVIPQTVLLFDEARGTVELEDKECATYQVGTWAGLRENRAPSRFSLGSPMPAARVSFRLPSDGIQFTWYPAVDPNQDPVEYILLFAKDAQMEEVVAAHVAGPWLYASFSASALRQLLGSAFSQQPLYWAVRASDGRQETTCLNPQPISFEEGAETIPPLLCDYGDVWKYEDHKNLDGTQWNQAGYDDRRWKQGRGVLGFGAWQQETATTKLAYERTTYYFRKTMVLEFSGKAPSLTARVKFDDGFVFYVNGQPVYRANVKENPRYEDYAKRKHSSSISFTIAGDFLVRGLNVFACELHQSDFLSSDVAFDARLERGQNSTAISAGPWLTLPIDQTMTVVWETSEAASSEIHYGLTPELGQKVSNPAPVTMHKLTTGKLKAGETYYYKVISGAVHSSINDFQAPPAATASIRVGCYGDTRTCEDDHHTVVEAMAGQKPSLILHTGDIVEKGNNRSEWYEQFLTPTRKVIHRIPMVVCHGNHDGSTSGNLWDFMPLPANAPDPAGFYYFSFDYGPLFVIIMDSERPYTPGTPQFTHLLNDLQASRYKPWTAVVLHRATYSSGVGHGGIENPQLASELVPLFERYGVDFVIAGHDHMYERSVKDGIQHLVAGGGGAPPGFGLWSINSYKVCTKSFIYQYTLLDLTPTQAVLSSFTPDGKCYDRVTIEAARPEIHVLQPEGSVEEISLEKGKYLLKGPESAFTANRGSMYRLYFHVRDNDSPATIAFYLDRDNQGFDGHCIAQDIPKDGNFFYEWHVPSDFPTGVYFIYAIIRDGQHEGRDYSPFAIRVK